MRIIQLHLPPHCYSKKPKTDEGTVIHYFSCIIADPEHWDNAVRCWQLFYDLNLEEKKRRFGPWDKEITPTPARMFASADYLIGRDGAIYELVAINNRRIKTWHAGESTFSDPETHEMRHDCNTFMQGWELIAAPQISHDYDFTEEQYISVANMAVYQGQPLNRITGHENIAPGRKVDPGPTWDWDKFRYYYEVAHDN